MKKTCPLCNQELKTGDTVVALMLAKYTGKENSYDLQVMAQTISSHLFCVNNSVEVKAEESK